MIELIGHALHSPWLVLILALAVTADGPFPFLPSEPLLFGAVGMAVAGGDAARVAALFLAALAGSLLGDAVLYRTGRLSRRVVPVTARDTGLRAWIARHLHRRPVLVLVSVRLVPGGRLAGVTGAGRVHVPVRRFAVATAVSSLVWAAYMTGVGVLVGPLTAGDPLRSLLVGLGSAVVVVTVMEIGRRVLAYSARPAR